MSKKVPDKIPTELVCTITKQDNRIMSNWHGHISQAIKVQILNNLAFAEHEILIRYKYYHQSNIVDPHTGKNIIIEKEGIKSD